MLAVTGLVVLWARLAFAGRWDLSSDHRATGLFWEVHLGGSALQAVLVVGVPFGAAAPVRAATLRAALFPLAALAMGALARTHGDGAPGWVCGLFALLGWTRAGLLWWARPQGGPACALPAADWAAEPLLV